MMFFGLLLTMALVACALYDLWEFRIPNVLTVIVAVLFVPWSLLQPLPVPLIAGSVLVAGLVFVCGALAFQFGLIGGGDVKLLAGTCLWAGPYAVLAHLMLTSILAAGLLILLVAVRWLYPTVLAVVPQVASWPTPRMFQHGGGIPYGVAIAASAILLGFPRAF